MIARIEFTASDILVSRYKSAFAAGVRQEVLFLTTYSELRARAVEFVSRWSAKGDVLVVAATREAADEVALAACGEALIGVQRAGFRPLVLDLSAAELNR